MMGNENVPADVVRSGPSAQELSALLERQDDVLSALLGELETCKTEITNLRTTKLQKQEQQQQQPQVSVDMNQDKQTDLGKSFQEIPKDEKTSDESKKSLALEAFMEELKKARFEMENLSTELGTKNAELSRANEASASKQAHIDHLSEIFEKEREKKNNEFSKLNERLIEKTMECDRLSAEINFKEARLKVLEDTNANKERLVSDLTKGIAKELTKREEEDKVLATRLSVLADENTTLRASLLTLGANVNELPAQVKKLLEQQRDFIETLKSECEILVDRLARERSEHRKERKQMKRQIRHLNARLEYFISGKQEEMTAEM